MSCCLDTNHFVGTPTFLRLILWIFTLWGRDHFVSPVTDNLLFSNKWKREKNPRKSVNLGSACKKTQLQCPMGCHGHHAILCKQKQVYFRRQYHIDIHLVVLLNNFASMSNCPWVHSKSNRPLPLPRCVCVWGGGIVIP